MHPRIPCLATKLSHEILFFGHQFVWSLESNEIWADEFQKRFVFTSRGKLFLCFLKIGNSTRFVELSRCRNHGKTPWDLVEKIALRLKQRQIRVRPKNPKSIMTSLLCSWIRPTWKPSCFMSEYVPFIHELVWIMWSVTYSLCALIQRTCIALACKKSQTNKQFSRCCPIEVSVMMGMFCICTVQYDSEPLKVS